jgi:FMN-dependent NADH-azoreductase
VFGVIGVTELEFIVAEGVQREPEHRTRALEGALQTVSGMRVAA